MNDYECRFMSDYESRFYMSEIESLRLQLEESRDEVEEETAIRDRLAKLLAETAIALKGEESALTKHSWHDLGWCSAEVVHERDKLRQELQEVCNAIGSTEYMDPPDGGSVTIAEQVIRMKEERDQLRQRVKLLRDKVDWLRRYGCKDDLAFRVAQDTLIATDPNPQQSRNFADQLTDDDFLHMIDESNFAQERE